MKCKEIFKKWWFWAIVIAEFVLQIIPMINEYGSLFFGEYLGVFLGSFIVATMIISVGFVVLKSINWIRKKVTKR